MAKTHRLVFKIIPDDPEHPPRDREPVGIHRQVEFLELRAGDRFQLFEPDGTFVVDATATGDAYSFEGLLCVECLDVPKLWDKTPTVDGIHVRNIRHG